MRLPSLYDLLQKISEQRRRWWRAHYRQVLGAAGIVWLVMVLILTALGGAFRSHVSAANLFPFAKGRMWVYRVTVPGRKPGKCFYRVLQADKHGALMLYNENHFRQELRWSYEPAAYSVRASALFFATHPSFTLPARLRAGEAFPCAFAQAMPGTAQWNGKRTKVVFAGQSYRGLEINFVGADWQERATFIPKLGLLHSDLWLKGQWVRREELLQYLQP